MNNFKFFTILFTSIIVFSCNDDKTSDKKTFVKITQEQLDTVEKQLTTNGYFWQSKNSLACRVEILFREDGTATALGQDNKTYVKGNWTFDKSTNKLQIAWENADQVLTEVVSINAEGTEISFSNHVYFVCGTKLKRLNLLDKRFDERLESYKKIDA
jgi:hypothetical protein